MADDQAIEIPSKLWFYKILGGNHIRQLQYPALTLDGGDALKASLEPGKHVELHGKRILISKAKRQAVPDGFDDVLCTSGGNKFEWSKKHDMVYAS